MSQWKSNMCSAGVTHPCLLAPHCTPETLQSLLRSPAPLCAPLWGLSPLSHSCIMAIHITAHPNQLSGSQRHALCRPAPSILTALNVTIISARTLLGTPERSQVIQMHDSHIHSRYSIGSRETRSQWLLLTTCKHTCQQRDPLLAHSTTPMTRGPGRTCPCLVFHP